MKKIKIKAIDAFDDYKDETKPGQIMRIKNISYNMRKASERTVRRIHDLILHKNACEKQGTKKGKLK